MSTDLDLTHVDRIVAEHGRSTDAVIPILRAAQEAYGYLPDAALRRVSEISDISVASIAGVATFYSQFRTRRGGRHTVKVCVGTACHLRGAEDVYGSFREHLGIAEDEDTDAERLFTVEQVACLGCCMLAPAVQVDDVTYGHIEPGDVQRVLTDFVSGLDLRASRGSILGLRARDAEGEIRTCLCSSCMSAGAEPVHRECEREIRDLALPANLIVVGCTGGSYQAPVLEIAAGKGAAFRYGRVAAEDVRSLLLRHFRPAGTRRRVAAAVTSMVEKWVTDDAWKPVTRYRVDVRQGPDAQYYGRQQHLATEHAWEVDPLDLDAYRARGGFIALRRCLTELAPEEVVAQIQASGLRGRGGAGFPTGVKWNNVREADGGPKYVVCNGDEGDPGAFMDRMLLESVPFRVIEGLAIASRAVGAAEGFVYVRGEYPLAVRRIEQALDRCREGGLIGDDVLGSGHSLRVKLVVGAGAFVCGEETALLAAIEGRRGMPRVRPPYPSEKGLWQRPTLVNNVETLSLVPWILRHGPDAFAAIGTAESAGTKAFALAGKVVRSGLIEVPLGMTLMEIVEEVGGGVPDGKSLKGIQVGGPAGGCVPARLADTPVDYQTLLKVGAIMGSGGMVVLDENDCMVDLARYFMEFARRESCGRCTFCRIGTVRMAEILDDLCHGDATPAHLTRLEHLAGVTRRGSLCGLGRSAPNTVLSTLEHFRDECLAHVQGRCPAKKCKALITYAISDDCIGCTRCAQRCPAEAILSIPYAKHEILDDRCTRCDLCRQVCPAGAVGVR